MGGGHCVFSNYSNYLAALQKLWVFLEFFTSFLGKISLTSFLVYRKAEREGGGCVSQPSFLLRT